MHAVQVSNGCILKNQANVFSQIVGLLVAESGDPSHEVVIIPSDPKGPFA